MLCHNLAFVIGDDNITSNYVAKFSVPLHKRHPEIMGATEIDEFLSHLAVQKHVAASTQKTALNALVFLYQQFLGRTLGKLHFALSHKPKTLPTVFSHTEAMSVIESLDGHYTLAVSLMYGSGLRVMEAMRLRIQDIDFANNCLVVRESKGMKCEEPYSQNP